MVRNFWRMIVLLIALWAMAGCVSTTQYSQIAQAGANYYTALDSLLVRVGDLYVDTNSERLLSDDAKYQADFQEAPKKHLSTTEIEQLKAKIEQNLKTEYGDKGKNDKDNQKITNRLRAHAALLGDYFNAMNQLATSSAPTNIGQSTGTIATNLQTIGNLLRTSAPFPDPGIFQQIAPLAVNVVIKAALRKELQERNLTIQTELLTQQELLKVLERQIQNNLKLTQVIREKRLLNEFLSFQALEHSDTWIANRRQIIEWQNTVKELGAAQAAAKKLLQAYQAMVSGDITLERFNELLLTLKPIIIAAGSFNQ